MSQIFPSEASTPTPTNLNPTVFSVGRPVGGALPSMLLSTDANGNLTTSTSVSAFGAQPLDATLTALSGLSSGVGFLYQTGADSFSKYSLTGTANQVTITNNGSGFTFSTPQNIDTGASLQLAKLAVGTSDFGLATTAIKSAGNSTNYAFRVYNSDNTAIFNLRDDGIAGFGGLSSGSRLALVGPGNTSSTNSLRCYNSDLTTTFQVQDNGYVGIGTTSTASKLAVSSTVADANGGGVLGSVITSQTTATTRTNYGVYGEVTNSQTLTNNSILVGVWGVNSASYVPSGFSNAASNGQVVAGYFDSRLNAPLHAGTFAAKVGVYAYHGAMSTSTGGGTITNDYGMRVLTAFTGPTSGIIGTSFGVHLSGTGTTNYPTTLWGFYEGYATATNAANYFANPLLIGTTSRAANFTIARSNSAAAWGTNGINIRTNVASYTDTSTTSGTTVTSNAVHSLSGGTLVASNDSVTYTHAYNLYLGTVPAAGTNVTITNPWALWASAGACKLNNTFIGTSSVYDTTYPNTNVLSGSAFTGVQVRGTSTYKPTLEFFRYTNSIASDDTIGRISAWSGATTAVEVSRIETLSVGTSENAGSLVFSTATGGTLTERFRILSTGGWGFGGTTAAQSTGWAVTNPSVLKSLDVSTADIATLRQVVGTLIDVLKAHGILGA